MSEIHDLRLLITYLTRARRGLGATRAHWAGPRLAVLGLCLAALGGLLPAPGSWASTPAEPLSEAAVGALMFNDRTLAEPKVFACVDCHRVERGFANPGDQIVTAGATGHFGARNSLSLTYAALIPPFTYDQALGIYRGGQFWDGRADSLEEQAEGPLFNPIEMNLTPALLAERLRAAPYKDDLTRLYGADIWQSDLALTRAATRALAAFQRDGLGQRFSSKFDAFRAGKVELSAQEAAGLALFEGRAQCASCHPLTDSAGPPLLSDFGYYNIGVPVNMNSPFLHVEPDLNPQKTGYRDPGLAGSAKIQAAHRASARGRFRTPSLRNVALTGPYMHNGVFRSLTEVVEFFNRRDVDPDRFGPPEIQENIERDRVGNLKLKPAEIEAIVAFLETLTDGFAHSVNADSAITNSADSAITNAALTKLNGNDSASAAPAATPGGAPSSSR